MLTNYLQLPAPAKLNLFLHITGQRDDGYHELQSVFQFIDLCDTLEFELSDDASIVLNTTLDIPVQDNIIYRAAQCLQAYQKKPQGIKISLEKNIPMGGGLGGGSSNAATTLLALNKLWSLNLPLDNLLKIGAKLGADVPIFIHGHAAWAEGIGERLTSIDLEEPWFVVINPGCHVDTANIFSDPQLTRDQSPCTIEDFRDGRTQNICEPVAKQRHTEIAQALEYLSQYGLARMTGTGCCVFVACDEIETAQTIVRQCPVEYSAFIAKGLNQSPLQKKLGFF